jgi:hypothetical protein
MGTFWIFCIWAFLPLIPYLEQYKETILYISSGFIQLAALPLLMVGQQITGEQAEARDIEDHYMILNQFSRMEDAMHKLSIILEEVRELHKDTHKLLGKHDE